MTAGEIIALLKERHYRDVCVEQCKTGITTNSGGVATANDAWTDFCMKRCAQSSGEREYWYSAWLKALKAESPMMDLWVLPRKWKGGEPICYEVKISRSDLFGDRKFPDYWIACNWFFFVIPRGLATQAEMDKFPPQCGFMEVNASGGGLRVRRKPCYMAAAVDPWVYRYVIMWRSKIVPSRYREFHNKSAAKIKAGLEE